MPLRRFRSIRSSSRGGTPWTRARFNTRLEVTAESLSSDRRSRSLGGLSATIGTLPPTDSCSFAEHDHLEVCPASSRRPDAERCRQLRGRVWTDAGKIHDRVVVIGLLRD